MSNCLFFVLSQPWSAAEEEVRASQRGHRTYRKTSGSQQVPLQICFETLITLCVCCVLQFLPATHMKYFETQIHETLGTGHVIAACLRPTHTPKNIQSIKKEKGAKGAFVPASQCC